MGQRLSKAEVINFRVDSETKEVMKKAAKISGLDLSAYIISKAKEAATEDIIRHSQVNKILLADEDFETVESVISKPATATAKLRTALKKHSVKK
ncbi:MAG: DUF1778 domain-containing protein [Bdellovibrionaceae bacterium]|nr:DUF1778 domain-containing protein [Pseudobdellovibrionaceae bacterium]